MSVQAMTAVFARSRMGGTTRLVLLAIANYHGDAGAWPSIDSLARDCRMSRRAVQDCLRRAEAAGELHVESNAGQRGTNRYWLHLEEGGCRFCTGADSRRESAPEPKEPPTQGLPVGHNYAVGTTPQEPPTASDDNVRPLTLSDRVPYFLGRLVAQDEAWAKVTPGACVKIARASSMDAVVTALSFAAASAPVLEGSAYGWLQATARGLHEAATA